MVRQGTRVLVVEDDRYIAGLVEMELEHRGFEVGCAYDGPSALEAAQKFDPAVIVLDIMLPGLDGVGVLKRLRSGGSRAPVVMLTARDAQMDKVHSLDLGGGRLPHQAFPRRRALGSLEGRAEAS